MAFMKFYVGNEANASSHRDGIYIAVDTKKIFYNGSAYGGSEVDLSNYYTIAQVNGKIGTNVYTGANYISKETNLTEAVLQLDEEIKATNDNLALEHTNAEATYAKKTELGKKLDISTYTSDKATFALKSEIPNVSNFLTISNAQSTYLTKTDARNTYQPKGSYLTSVSIATISDLNANWDALLKSDPSGHVTRWPNISEVGSRKNLTISFNGGTTEGTDKFTYDVTAAKSINITPSLIGAAASSHTHTASQVSGLSRVATSGSYNDLTNKPAIPSAYTLPKATTSTLGGIKVGDGLEITGDGTLNCIIDPGSGSVYWGNIDGKPAVFPTNIASISDLHANWDSVLKSAPTSYVTRWPSISEVTGKQNLVIKLNGGSTEGTSMFTFNGTGAKSVNITASNIGAAASSHSHTKSQITDFPTTWAWGNISGKPSFATVATSGSYNDLTNKPSIPSLSGYATQEWVNGRGFLTKSTADGYYQPKGNYLTSVSWSQISGKPTIPSVSAANNSGTVTLRIDSNTITFQSNKILFNGSSIMVIEAITTGAIDNLF